MIIQQGDVVMKRIDSIPAGQRTEDDLTRSKILATGESTGHVHALVDDTDSAQVVRVMDQLYMIIERATTLKHEEHNPVTIPPGTYQVDIVKEADHISGVVRQVAD
jgi:hypothetical protein